MEMIKFKYKEKKISIEVEECKNIFSRTLGLMFRRKSKPLLFIFKNKNRRAIHSFFCVPFIVIWFDGTKNFSKKNSGASKTKSFEGEKIIDIKYVRPWRMHIKPQKKFDKFLEIPVGNKEFKPFSDEFRKV